MINLTFRDQIASAREGHQRKRRQLFLHKQRRGYRSWAKFIADASESYDEFQLQYESQLISLILHLLIFLLQKNGPKAGREIGKIKNKK
jgi:hypothetical protein